MFNDAVISRTAEMLNKHIQILDVFDEICHRFNGDYIHHSIHYQQQTDKPPTTAMTLIQLDRTKAHQLTNDLVLLFPESKVVYDFRLEFEDYISSTLDNIIKINHKGLEFEIRIAGFQPEQTPEAANIENEVVDE